MPVRIKEQVTQAGPLIEVDFFPVFSDSGRRISDGRRKSSEARQKYNRQQSAKQLVMLANANFDKSDYIMTYTYHVSADVDGKKTASRDFQNFIRRLKTEIAKQTKKAKAEHKRNPTEQTKARLKRLQKPLKYLYVVEKTVYKTGAKVGQMRLHIHAFVSGVLSRDEMEKKWEGRTDIQRFNPDAYGPESFARYMAKDGAGIRKFKGSKNLIKPTVRESKKTTPKNYYKKTTDKEYWERRYKGYKFIRCNTRMNPYNGYWYTSVVMYKSPTAPPWEFEDFNKFAFEY